jgi:hypothetical protein
MVAEIDCSFEKANYLEIRHIHQIFFGADAIHTEIGQSTLTGQKFPFQLFYEI